MRYLPINPDLFRYNRKRFMRKMQPESIAIFHSNDQYPRNGDTHYPFRQNSGLFYLSGLDQEETVVVLFPDCVKDGFQEIAFIKRTNEFIATWQGPKLTQEDARAISGIERIFWLDEMPVILHELILLAKRIYVNTEEHDRFLSEIPSRNLRATKALMEQYPVHKYHRAQPILKKLTQTKSPLEVELIKYAIAVTGQAFQRVLETVHPGMMEYEVEAEITHEFIRNRANGHAYDPIIAGGPAACILHYTQNNRPLKDGELVLLDFGAEYANYASDLTRTIPVNGQFSARQREVYQAVLGVLTEARQLLVPGTTLDEYQREVVQIMEGALVDLKLLSRKEIEQQNPQQPLYKKYFMHGASHHLGLAVHDLADRYDPFQAGMVFTCEPGIYIWEEGLGIRLENNILVTDHGPVDLMENIPIAIEEIETLMNTRSTVAG